jgi:hypothetical protein
VSRRHAFAASAALVLLLLAGCSGTGNIREEARLVPLPDGRTVVCVVSAGEGGEPGGIDCDWGHAR